VGIPARRSYDGAVRVGRNPAKQTATSKVEVAVPAPISVGLLTHAPFLSGYHAQALDVIRLAVLSAKRNAGRPIHLLVVDNGSCDEVRDWLVDALRDGHIDQLVLNRANHGKVTAVSQILLGAPGPDVVYSDGDLYFEPGWLDPMLAVRDAFPEAGVIGGAPTLAGNSGRAERSEGRTLREPPADTEVETGRFVPESYVRRWLAETGFEGDALEERLAEVTSVEDTRLRRGEVSAMWDSPHCQFMVTSTARAKLEPRVGAHALNSMETHGFDHTLDALGMLRLSVVEPVYRHVGNRLGDEDRAALDRLAATNGTRPGAGANGADAAGERTLRSSFWGLTPVRRAARRLHHWTFRILYESEPRPRRARR